MFFGSGKAEEDAEITINFSASSAPLRTKNSSEQMQSNQFVTE